MPNQAGSISNSVIEEVLGWMTTHGRATDHGRAHFIPTQSIILVG
jgi:hypothetical protein